MDVSGFTNSDDCETYATGFIGGVALGAILSTQDKSTQLPVFVESITGEVEPGYWKPQSIEEWSEVQKITAFLKAWIQQQGQERSLRKMIGIWVFILITLQVIGVFGLVVLDACKVLVMNAEIVKFLIPSVLSEVFGMGFVVVKYLFKPASINPLDFERQRRGN
jgi:hypothetical protein